MSQHSPDDLSGMNSRTYGILRRRNCFAIPRAEDEGFEPSRLSSTRVRDARTRPLCESSSKILTYLLWVEYLKQPSLTNRGRDKCAVWKVLGLKSFLRQRTKALQISAGLLTFKTETRLNLRHRSIGGGSPDDLCAQRTCASSGVGIALQFRERRMRDLNPRKVALYTLSKRAHSAAMRILQQAFWALFV